MRPLIQEQRTKTPNSRFDKKTGLWIRHRKLVYLCWYEYLLLAEHSSLHRVKWSKYRTWGGKDIVLQMSFWEWWEDYWAKNFGVKDQNTAPKMILGEDPSRYLKGKNVPNPQIKNKTIAYFVYLESLREGNAERIYWNRKTNKVRSAVRGDPRVFTEIAERVVETMDQENEEVFVKRREQFKKGLRGCDVRQGGADYGQVENTHGTYQLLEGIRTGRQGGESNHHKIGERVRDYLNMADKTLRNVCEGKFP